MLKVLIVDDELLARLALRTAIQWDQYGFEVVAEAEDGLTGYQYVKEYQPDIVLTDISMPGINGVELIKKIKGSYPDTEIIILSCHNDFEYVKEGLRSGASNYILKLSMSMEDLLKELLQLKDKIMKRHIEHASVNKRTGKERWTELLFSLLAAEEASIEKELDIGRRQGLIGGGEYAFMAVLAVDGSEEDFTRYNQVGMIENLVESVMVRYKVGYYVPVEHNRGIILCQMDKDGYQEKKTTLKALLEELLIIIRDYLGTYASAGISCMNHINDLKVAYQQAYEAVSQKFYAGPGKVHLYETVKQLEGNQEVYYKELLKAVSTVDFDVIKKRTEIWLSEVIKYRQPDIGSVRKNIHELIFQINLHSIASQDKKSDFGSLEKTYHQIQKQIYATDMQSTLDSFLEEVRIGYVEAKGSKREIALAKKYVSLNYQSNIKLSEVAEYVNMNMDYFSHLFKKETGSSFTDYVNEFRIEKAKPMLRSGQYKVYEAAFAVGFQDENYFTRRFKKQTGYTPHEFIRL